MHEKICYTGRTKRKLKKHMKKRILTVATILLVTMMAIALLIPSILTTSFATANEPPLCNTAICPGCGAGCAFCCCDCVPCADCWNIHCEDCYRCVVCSCNCIPANFCFWCGIDNNIYACPGAMCMDCNRQTCACICLPANRYCTWCGRDGNGGCPGAMCMDCNRGICGCICDPVAPSALNWVQQLLHFFQLILSWLFG